MLRDALADPWLWGVVAVIVGLTVVVLVSRQLKAGGFSVKRGELPARAFNILEPGKRYQVIQAFTDYDNRPHPVGEAWTFLTYTFLPYEDGLSWFVSPDEGAVWHIRLQWRPEAGQQYEVASYPEQFLEAIDTPTA